MLTNRDYTDTETTLELKKLGFPVWYIYHDLILNKAQILLSHAQKWLREAKNIMIEVPISFMDNGVWKFSFRIQTPDFYDRAIGEWDSYEDALLAGIKEAINILKGEK